MKLEKSQLLFIGLALLVATLPLVSSSKLFFLVNRVSIAIILIAWIFIDVISKKINWKEKFKNPLLLSFFILYLLNLIGIIYSSDTITAFGSVEKKLPLLIFPVIILTTDSLSIREVKKLLWIFVFSVTVTCLICVAYAFHRNNYWDFFLNPNWFYFSYSDLTEIVGIQPIYLSLYVELSFFIGLLFILTRWSTIHILIKMVGVMQIGFLYLIIFLLAGKMAILSTTVGIAMLLFYLLYKAKRTWLALLSTGSIIVISLVLITQLPIVKERFMSAVGMERTSQWVYGDPNQAYSGEARLVKWKATFNLIIENWLIGVGPGDMQGELNKEYDRIGFQLGIQESFNPHNQFLQTWLSTGIFGLLSIIGIVYFAFARSFNDENLLLFVISFIFAANCLTESMLERQYGIFLFSIFLCLCYKFRTFDIKATSKVVSINS